MQHLLITSTNIKQIFINLLHLFFFQAEDGIRDAQESRGLGDVYKRQDVGRLLFIRIYSTAILLRSMIARLSKPLLGHTTT